MKHFPFFFLLSVGAFAQNDNVSVISAEKLNVIYRGVPNPIKIAVPGAKSFSVSAEGYKFEKIDSLGNYKLYPGAGKEAKILIEAQMEDGSVLREEKVFRIYGLSAPVAKLYGAEGFTKLTSRNL